MKTIDTYIGPPQKVYDILFIYVTKIDKERLHNNYISFRLQPVIIGSKTSLIGYIYRLPLMGQVFNRLEARTIVQFVHLIFQLVK